MAARGRDLEGKVALVVGSGVPGGIGEASARALAEAGARLVLADLASTKLDEVVKSFAADGHEACGVPVDLVDESAVAAMLALTTKTYGRLDALVNNAAATNLVPYDDGVIDMSAEIWDKTFAVNTRGPMFVCKYAIPLMLAGGGGSIVNISSGQSLRGDAHGTAYAASKAALNAMTRSIATMYGDQGIRCNTISTGVIQSTLMKSIVPPAMAELIGDCTLLGRLGRVEEMADLVVFLASGRSSYITAQIIQCDGGILENVPIRSGLRRLEKSAQHLHPAEQ